MIKRGKIIPSKYFIIILIFLIININLINSKVDKPEKIENSLKKKFIDNSTKIGVIIKIDKQKYKEKNWKYEKNHKYNDYIYKELNISELNNLENSNEVLSISRSYKLKSFLSEARTIINADQTHSLLLNGVNMTGIGQVVCEIDTGVDFTHPDLIGKNKSCVIDCYNKSCIENCSIGDDNGHGTMVAGILAATGGATGIAPGIKLIAVKILDSNGYSAADFDLSNAIDYCVNENVSVISLSLGTTELFDSDCGSYIQFWTDSINNAYLHNVSIIAAAGNDGNYTHIAAPACIGNVSAVGMTYDNSFSDVIWPGVCTDSPGNTDKIACASNRNQLLKLFAPGAMITTTYPGGGYQPGGGTSMSTPMVSASFAIIYQMLNLTGQRRNPKEIELIFNDSGREIYDSRSNINFSRINLTDAIFRIDNMNPNVTLISPYDNSVLNYRNIELTCNASDLYLYNETFYLWMSGTLINRTNHYFTGQYHNDSINIYNLDSGTYEWNCLYSDYNGNIAFANNNFSFQVIEPEFGVIHSIHTTISDGTMSQSQRVNNLKTYYDWAVSSDHDIDINTNEWSLLKNETNNNNSENFTYLLGYEWKGVTSNNAESLIFFSDNGPLDKINGNDTLYDSFNELTRWLRNNSGIGCLNHPARFGNTMDWNEVGVNNITYLPCIEIINKQYYHWNDYFNCSFDSGCQTYQNPSQDSSNWSGSVKNALDNGLILGFVAGWDHHSGIGEPIVYTGLANPYNFSRTGIVETIRRRHTWASQDRITMQIKVNNGSEDFIMGDRFNMKTRYLDFNYSVNARPNKNIENISLYLDGIIINFSGNINLENTSGEIQVILNDSDEHYIFLEASQDDANRSWSSPIYITSLLLDEPPNMTSISISYTSSNVTIILTTDILSNYTLYYGTNLNKTQNNSNNTFASYHNIFLNNLESQSTYYFNLTLCDRYNNCNSTITYNFTTTAVSSTDNSGGSSRGSGGGGLKQAFNIYVPLEIELLQGYNKSLKENEKIKFNLNKCEYQIIVKEIVKDKIYVELTGADGSKFRFKLSANEFEKLNLNSSKYNFFLKINKIENNSAEISIRFIDEDIIKKKPRTENSTLHAFENPRVKTDLKTIELGKILFYIAIAILIILITLVIYYFIKLEIKRNKQKENLKEYRKTFLDYINPKNENAKTEQ